MTQGRLYRVEEARIVADDRRGGRRHRFGGRKRTINRGVGSRDPRGGPRDSAPVTGGTRVLYPRAGGVREGRSGDTFLDRMIRDGERREAAQEAQRDRADDLCGADADGPAGVRHEYPMSVFSVLSAEAGRRSRLTVLIAVAGVPVRPRIGGLFPRLGRCAAWVGCCMPCDRNSGRAVRRRRRTSTCAVGQTTKKNIKKKNKKKKRPGQHAGNRRATGDESGLRVPSPSSGRPPARIIRPTKRQGRAEALVVLASSAEPARARLEATARGVVRFGPEAGERGRICRAAKLRGQPSVNDTVRVYVEGQWRDVQRRRTAWPTTLRGGGSSRWVAEKRGGLGTGARRRSSSRIIVKGGIKERFAR